MQSENLSYILKIITHDGGHVKVNKKLVSVLGIEAAFIYSELVNLQLESEKTNAIQDIDGDYYFYLPSDKFSEHLSLTPHKQRTILQLLQDNKLINIYYGLGNVRMISVSGDSYNLSNLINKHTNDTEIFFENLSTGIANLKKFFIQNLQGVQRKQLSLFEDEFMTYLKNNKSIQNTLFEKKIFEMLTTDSFKDELINFEKICS